MPQLGVAIAVVVVVSGLFAFAQEYRADRAGQRLRDLLPALALGAEPPSRSALRGPARTGRLVDTRVLGRAFGVLGPAEAAVQLGAFLTVLVVGGWRWGATPPAGLLAAASGTAFTVVVFGQLTNAFACRSESRAVGRWSLRGYPLLLGAVACELALLWVFLALPPIANVLGHAPPTPLGWALAATVAPAVLLVDAGQKAVLARKRRDRKALGERDRRPCPQPDRRTEIGPMKTSTVADVMTCRVLTACPAMPLKELARVLTENGVSALPVLDPDDRVIGMASERDLLSKQARPLPGSPHWWQRRRVREEIRRAESDTVGHMMTEFPVTIAPDASLAEAARRMIEHDVKHLPVINHAGALVGVVSRADLVRAYVRSDDEIRDAVLNEVFRHVLWVDPTEVDVTVTDGIVTLSGTVEQRSTAEIAERLVHRLDGVVDVVSDLEYRLDDGGIGGRPSHHARSGQRAATPTRSTP